MLHLSYKIKFHQRVELHHMRHVEIGSDGRSPKQIKTEMKKCRKREMTSETNQ